MGTKRFFGATAELDRQANVYIPCKFYGALFQLVYFVCLFVTNIVLCDLLLEFCSRWTACRVNVHCRRYWHLVIKSISHFCLVKVGLVDCSEIKQITKVLSQVYFGLKPL